MNKKLDNLWHRYSNWWLNSFPPLHGALRFFVYTALLLSALFQSNKSPIRGIWYYETTDPQLFRSYGLIKLLNIPYIAPEYIRIVIMILIVAWFCAAIGLFTRVSSIITAIALSFIHGIFLGSNAFNHAWFLTMYAFIALCFANTNDAWSVDYYLKKYLRKKKHQNINKPVKNLTIADTGFARQLFLVLTVGFYFAAGFSKLQTAGIAWANGHLIQYFAECYSKSFLGDLLANNLWLSAISAIISFSLELGAIFALFSRQARFILVLGWLSLHLGIMYSLGPRYIQNIICLTLLIDWKETINTVRRWLIAAKKKLLSPKLSLPLTVRKKLHQPIEGAKASVKNTTNNTTSAVIGGTCVIFLMASVALGQIFWWPLTTVYMYSSNYSNFQDIRADYPRIDYYNPAKVQTIARDFLNSNPSIEATQYLAFRICLRLVGENDHPLYLFDATESYSVGVPKWKQFILTIIRPISIADFASKPPQQFQFNPDHPEYPAQKFLSDYVPILRNHVSTEIWQQYNRVELVYPIINSESYAIADRSPIPEEIWQHYKEMGDELLPIPEARFIPIASVSIE